MYFHSNFTLMRSDTPSIPAMPELVPILTRDEIDSKVARVAGRISSDYANSRLILVGVLKGAFVYLSDLIRHLKIPVQIDFVRAASYGVETASSGRVCLSKEPEIDPAGRDVLIVEDIIDSGLTLAYLIEYFKARGAGSVKTSAFIDKRERREISVPVDYACHVVQEGFLVGYGLDYAENYRELPGLYHLKFD